MIQQILAQQSLTKDILLKLRKFKNPIQNQFKQGMQSSPQEKLPKSTFHSYREKYQPRAPKILNQQFLEGVYNPIDAPQQIKTIFPKLTGKSIKALNFKAGEQKDSIRNALRIGCVLSGGQAAGGHNVIVGIYDYIKRRHPNSQLFGFLNGPKGIFTGKYMQITEQQINYFKNRGGFDMICSGRDKIESKEQKEKSLKYCESLKLDGLVVIGGDDSNTNAALLAEFFLQRGSNIKVVGCPKTIDGDLKNQFVEISFGFDTACKTYSQCIGSVMADTLSSKKYYHFIRLMGRSASHIALQCALLTRPTYTFIGEEIAEKNKSLKDLVTELTEIIIKRAENGRNFGVVLVPEGLIEFIPEINTLIKEINKLLSDQKGKKLGIVEAKEIINAGLSENSREVFNFMPDAIREQLLLERDPHGNVQVAKIETEKFLIDLVKRQLKQNLTFKGKFIPLANYFGYQGRCAFPTNFDCDYCYSLGLNAGAIIEAGETGMMSCVRGLEKQPQEWLPGGYPLITMMNLELRKGEHVPVIKKALVQLDGPLFKLYEELRQKWALGEYFNLVGPVQYEFPNERPYLAVVPTKQHLCPHAFKQYNQNQRPFAQITERNINQLSLALSKMIPECPQILKQSIQIVKSEELRFDTKELKVTVEKEFPFLSSQGHQMITFKRSTQLQQPKQGKKFRIGVSFNGRQCPAGHNIILGLLEENTQVFGFLGGTQGIYSKSYIQITQHNIEFYINSSGFHMLGRTKDKIRTETQKQMAKKVCQQLNLDGLVLIGASHTITDASSLTDFFIRQNVNTSVICVPSSIDNNISHQNLEVAVGFSTSSHMYSTLISNLMIDASSNTKYWYFIRLMGRDPSHLTLQCALSTHPNYTIISEEVEHNGWDLEELVEDIVRVIKRRKEKGLNFGCIVIPEGLPTFLPSILRIKTEIDQIGTNDEDIVRQKMSAWARQKFEKLPDFIRKQMFMRDDDGSLAFSQIETEKLLSYLVEKRLEQLVNEGKYPAKSFNAVCHFFGYQGRCAIPSGLDRNLSFTYGKIAKTIIQNGLTGFCPSVRGLTRPTKDWFPLAIPFTHMLQIKEKSQYGVNKPIVRSANVNLKSSSFKYFVQNREKWQLTDHYASPGPIQHFGAMSGYIPLTISLQERYDLDIVETINRKLSDLKSRCRFGTQTRYLQVIDISLKNLYDTLSIMEDLQK